MYNKERWTVTEILWSAVALASHIETMAHSCAAFAGHRGSLSCIRKAERRLRCRVDRRKVDFRNAHLSKMVSSSRTDGMLALGADGFGRLRSNAVVVTERGKTLRIRNLFGV